MIAGFCSSTATPFFGWPRFQGDDVVGPADDETTSSNIFIFGGEPARESLVESSISRQCITREDAFLFKMDFLGSSEVRKVEEL